MLVITLQRQLLVEVKSNQSSFLQFSCSLLSSLPPRISVPRPRRPACSPGPDRLERRVGRLKRREEPVEGREQRERERPGKRAGTSGPPADRSSGS